MSHELRTPLNGILGYTQIELMNPNVTEEYSETFKLIQECGEHLHTIIQDILDIARIEAGGDSYNEDILSLKDLVESAANIVRPILREKGLQIKIEVPDLYIKTDTSKIRQVLLNLISNASKFTKEGFIEVKAELIDDKLLKFKVSEIPV